MRNNTKCHWKYPRTLSKYEKLISQSNPSEPYWEQEKEMLISENDRVVAPLIDYMYSLYKSHSVDNDNQKNV